MILFFGVRILSSGLALIKHWRHSCVFQVKMYTLLFTILQFHTWNVFLQRKSCCKLKKTYSLRVTMPSFFITFTTLSILWFNQSSPSLGVGGFRHPTFEGVCKWRQIGQLSTNNTHDGDPDDDIQRTSENVTLGKVSAHISGNTKQRRKSSCTVSKNPSSLRRTFTLWVLLHVRGSKKETAEMR